MVVDIIGRFYWSEIGLNFHDIMRHNTNNKAGISVTDYLCVVRSFGPETKSKTVF